MQDKSQKTPASIACAHCGGKLTITDGQTFVTCPYCETEYATADLLQESDAVRTERLRTQAMKEMAHEQLQHQVRQQTKQEEKEALQAFKKSKFSKVLICCTIFSILMCTVSFSDARPWSGILAIIITGLLILSYLMGMQIVKEKKKGLRIVAAVVAFILIIPYFSLYNSEKPSYQTPPTLPTYTDYEPQDHLTDDNETEEMESSYVVTDTYSVQIELECVENLMFSRFDIDIFVDDTEIGTLEHGTSDTYELELAEGLHTLTVTEEGNSDVDGSISFTVSKDTQLKYELSCTSDQVEVNAVTDDEDETINSTPAASDPAKVVFDITQFENTTSEQLVEILGEPDNITETTERGFVEIPFTLYDYENHELGFVRFDLVNSKVVRITINGELPYNGGDILSTLNVLEINDDFVTEDEFYTKWECPTENIDLIHAALVDKENDTYASLDIQYDSAYYSEWSLPIDFAEQGLYRSVTEENVKNLLLSPSSADFPWIDWTYKKNDYYVLVESYVDAQNAFGAEIRNYFTFIYSTDTGSVVYAVLGDEVLVDNGYIGTADIIKDKVDK